MTRAEILALPNAVPLSPDKIKEEPEFRILLWPPEAIEKNDADTFCVTDVIARMIRPNASDCVKNDDFGKQRDYQSEDFKQFMRTRAWQALLSSDEIAKVIGDDVLREALPGISHWSQDWRQQTEFDSIVNLEYLELSTVVREGAANVDRVSITGISGALCGFALRPVKIRRNCQFLEDQPQPPLGSATFGRGAPTGSPFYKPMVWKVKFPTDNRFGAPTGSLLEVLKGWETVLPYGSDTTAIAYTAALAGHTSVAETQESFRPNQGFEALFTWLSSSGKGKEVPGFRLAFGSETYSIMFRHGAQPAIEKLGRGPDGKKTWQTWRVIEAAPVVDFADSAQGRVRVRVRRIAGRMCLDLQMGTFITRVVVMDARSTSASTGQADQKWELQQVKWPSGKFKVSSYGVSFSMNLSLLQHAVDMEKDFAVLSAKEIQQARTDGFAQPQPTGAQLAGVGAFSRFVFHPFAFPADADAITWRKQTAGAAFTKDCVVIPDPAFVPFGTDPIGHRPVGFYYTCGMRAANKGIDTPFVSSVTLACGASWKEVHHEPIDVGPCMVDASESGGEPGVTSSADWSIRLDPDLLDLQFPSLPEFREYGRSLPGWKRYVRRRNPVSFAVRWRYKDGTYSEWIERLYGNVGGVNETAGAAGTRTLSFTGRDELQRMVKPAAMCDHRFVPLDLPFAEKQGEPLYAVEAIYEIIKGAVGERYANRLNGGDGKKKPSLATLMRFLSPGFPALLSGSTDAGGFLPLEWYTSGGTPTQTGPLFPVPWNQDAMSWATTFASREFCLLFTGFPGKVNAGAWAFDGQRPCPIYGNYYTLMRDRPVWVLPDAVRITGDENFALRSIEAGDVPEWQFNEVLVWSMMEGAGTLPFPAIIQGGSRLDGNDPESADRSWRRTMIMQEAKMFWPGAAEVLSAQVMAMFANKQIRRTKFVFAGEAQMGWGDKVAPIMGEPSQSDPTGSDAQYSPLSMGVSGELFRVIRLMNAYKDVAGGVEGFQTSAACAPYNARLEG